MRHHRRDLSVVERDPAHDGHAGERRPDPHLIRAADVGRVQLRASPRVHPVAGRASDAAGGLLEDASGPARADFRPGRRRRSGSGRRRRPADGCAAATRWRMVALTAALGPPMSASSSPFQSGV